MRNPQSAPSLRGVDAVSQKAEDVMKSHHTIATCSLSLTLVLSCLLNQTSPPAAPAGGNLSKRALTGQPPATSPTETTPPQIHLTREQAREAYGKLELQFEANQGQTDASVNFLARGAGYTMFLKPAEAVFQLRNANSGTPRETAGESFVKTDDTQAERPTSRSAVLRMKLVGADAGAAVEGAGELAGKVNYFIGDDPAGWRANVPTFGQVRYREIYPGIDVVYYGNQQQLEYDFIVAPGHDARAVKLEFEGADEIKLDAAGDLLLTIGEGTLRQPKPFVYQGAGGGLRAVEAAYVVSVDGRVGFSLGAYDAALPLVIDPSLIYSTYLGGSNLDQSNAIAVDSFGNAYVCGISNSRDFPTANPFQATFRAQPSAALHDTFVTKLAASGSALVYSTYLGGDGDDRCNKLTADDSGNAYVVGTTDSTDFPLANPFQATYGSAQSTNPSDRLDGFVTKLAPSGSALVYSTYLGGSGSDKPMGVALDSSANVYVVGDTNSPNFPVANPFQATRNGGTDAFVTKFNATGSALTYSTYLGGSRGAIAADIKVDAFGNAYLTGSTSSLDFPTVNPIQSTLAGSSTNPTFDAFITKINASGSALLYSTYLGGSATEVSTAIALDSSANAYVIGMTLSTDFPTTNPFQPTTHGATEFFVTKLNATGSAHVYSTYLGGTERDSPAGIAVDSAGHAYVTGSTFSTDFPTVNPIQPSKARPNEAQDCVVAKFNAAGTSLIYSTYFGGTITEICTGIAVDSANNAYITGITNSTDVPVLVPFQNINRGDSDGFVTKIGETSGAGGSMQFARANYSVLEGLEISAAPLSLVINVSRTGDTSAPATVEYRTLDLPNGVPCDTANGTAYHRCDYATTLGTLSFAAGETEKSFGVSIKDDGYVEGNETFQLVLANPSPGASLNARVGTTVTIQDNDTQPPDTNPVDEHEAFVRAHYIDFLIRTPDIQGYSDWVNVLRSCGAGNGDRGRDPSCDRLIVSSSFFRSDEFLQVKGYFAYRFYEVAFARRPTYQEFVRDLQRLTGATPEDTAARRAAFTVEFTERLPFRDGFPAEMTPSAYVDALFNTAEIGDRQSITRQDGTTLTRAQLASRARADILREIVESREVAAIFYIRAFVSAQYFGYLRRDPESPGYDMWLAYLNAHPDDFRTMVNGFVNSVEYRLRFGHPTR